MSRCLGRRVGRLLVVEYLGDSWYRCECDCGNKNYQVKSTNLSHVKSCGCWRKQGDYNVRHGHCRAHTSGRTPTYVSWLAMWARCRNPQRHSAHRYVLRGISVCERWKVFENFLEDMGERPVDAELDRIDNNAGYCKENCRWVSHRINCNNKG